MTTGTTLVECRSDTHLTLPVVDRGGRGYCFNCVVEDYQSHAFNLALRVTGDSGLAGDGVQEALLSAYRGFGSFRGDNLRAWLLRIVANACRDILKSRRVRPSVSLDAMIIDPEDPSSPTLELRSTEESPEDYAVRQELGRVIEEGLRTVPFDQRQAVTLIDVQGFSYEEAAQIMACSLGTVKSRVSRGRGGLRDFMQTQGELLPARYRLDK